MATYLLILADDLTGAADCAARCRQAGLDAAIFVDAPQTVLPTGAIAFTTDSRYLSPKEAAQRVDTLLPAIVQQLDLTQSCIWYKKIDSTLRGNLGAELDAMLALTTPARQTPCALVCPAFPAQRRGLEDGFLVYAHTLPRTLHLPTLLAQQSQRNVAYLPLTTVRAGPGPLAQALTVAREGGAELLVVDAMSEEDLETLLTAHTEAAPSALLCGSAGLIGALAKRSSHNREDTSPTSAKLQNPILVVVGSGSVMAHRQLEFLAQMGAAHLVEIQPVTELEKITPPPTHSGQDWVLHLPKPAAGSILEGPAARIHVTRLGDATLYLLNQLATTSLLVVGGDTAIHLLNRLGVNRLQVQAELLPGIPLTTAKDATGRTWSIILKAGNHGDEQTLAQLLR